MKVAIDGPAGAGKSSVARAAAAELGFIYVDTGAIYRAVALYAVRKGVRTGDRNAVTALLPEITVELCHEDGEQRVILNGEDVSEAIRAEEISMAASNVSAMSEVRDFLFNLQRDIAEKNDVIMDGRDIGTVVLPEAEVKIFLTADPDERAKRRVLQLAMKGVQANYDVVLEDVKRRDWQDTHRETAPLRQAEDAILLDTTKMTEAEAIAAVAETVRKKDGRS